jgi:hypothetical protein
MYNSNKYCLIEVSKDIRMLDRLKICIDVIQAYDNY